MKDIKILDCTLRDGGYCNQWTFGKSNIEFIIANLAESNVDVIECGFLTNKVDYDSDITKFNDVRQVTDLIHRKPVGKSFVVMANYGEYNPKDLPVRDGSTIDGIRVAFHKKNVEPALKMCEEIKAKGYDVYVQAMVSMNYSDAEFLNLISKVNGIMPKAFYIVDSFGMMGRKDLTRLFYMVENNLNKEIEIGFHSHNNLQLAFSNAQTLIDMPTSRSIILDSSVYGMGRGAGNLNTELIIGYMNENCGTGYSVKPILTIMDEVLGMFFQRNPWGYTLPNYLSAMHNAHPNYAKQLNDKNTLTVEKMGELFEIMDAEARSEYDREYMENLYLRYMEVGEALETHLASITESVRGKTVLLIAPGKSSESEKERITGFVKRDDIISIGINFEYPHADTDFIFISNIRRFKSLDAESKKKCIVTSNLPADGVYLQTKYRDLVNDTETVRDNAGLMAIRFLINLGVGKILLAGFDGYSHDGTENYADQQMAYLVRSAVFDAMNKGMRHILNEYRNEVPMEFLTKPKHFDFGE